MVLLPVFVIFMSALQYTVSSSDDVLSVLVRTDDTDSSATPSGGSSIEHPATSTIIVIAKKIFFMSPSPKIVL